MSPSHKPSKTGAKTAAQRSEQSLGLDFELRTRLVAILQSPAEDDGSLLALEAALDQTVTDFRRDRLARKGGRPGKPVNKPPQSGPPGGPQPPPTDVVASVVVSPDTFAVNPTATVQLIATVRDAVGTLLDRVVTWDSSNDAVATVDATGLVTAVGSGAVSITATTEGVIGTALGTVTPPAVASVTVTPDPFSIATFATQQLTAVVKDAGDVVLTGRVVTWGSNNTAVATVSSTGLVTGVAAGSATITATCEGIQDSAGATVTAADVEEPASVSVSPSAFVITTLDTQQLTATVRDAGGNELAVSVAWTSGNPAVATVSSSGLVTPVTTGIAVISATAGEVVGTSTASVIAALVDSVTMTPVLFTLEEGSTQQMTVVVKDEDGNVLTGRVVTYSSSAPSVATVSSSGLVTANGEGVATITATCEGESDTSSVSVVAEGDLVFSPVNSDDTVLYVPEPHPTELGGDMADLPEVFIDSAKPVRTYETDVLITNQGSAAANMAAVNAAVVSAAALNGHKRIRLTHGLDYEGTIELQQQTFGTGWIDIEAATAPTAPGVRVTPADMSTAPRLLGVGNDIPVISCRRGADRYRIMGVTCTPQPGPTGVTYMTILINAREPGMTNEDSQALEAHCPRDIILDRIMVTGPVGDTNGEGRNRNAIMLNGIRCAVVASHIAGTYNNNDETHGIIITSTPGPLKIVNNRIPAGSIPIMSGGAGNSLGNSIHPSDIEIRRNHLYHPDEWCPLEEQPAGDVSLKGLFELKHAERVLFEGNVLERCPASAQTGMAIVIKSAGDGMGPSTGMGTFHATVRHNEIRNVRIALNVDGLGDPIETGVLQTHHISVYNNRFHDFGLVQLSNGDLSGINGSGAGNPIQLGKATDYLKIRRNTFVPNLINFSTMISIANVAPGTEAVGTDISDNVFISPSWSAPVFYDGGFYGNNAMDLYADSWVFARNFVLGVAIDYQGNIPTGTGNVSPISPENPSLASLITTADFVDAANADYRLAASSDGSGIGINGTDPGCDHDKVDLATSGVAD